MFSPQIMEHVERPRYAGLFEGATHVGRYGTPGGGPYVVLHLLVEDGTILRAGFDTLGCPASMGTAGVLCQIVTGRTVEQALRIEPEDLVLLVGGLPEGKEDRAPMTVAALRAALGGE
jgi:NifU-like protein involved in Fe-S cluster formation